MSDVMVTGAANATSDLLNRLAGIDGGSAIAALRAQRADIAALIQSNYEALLEPNEEAGVDRTERGLIALRVVTLEKCAALVDHYHAYLANQNATPEVVAATTKSVLAAPLSPRLMAILAHVDRLTNEPRVATPQDLAGLKAQGLSDANIVTISQLIAFISFQVRALVGIQLLGEGK